MTKLERILEFQGTAEDVEGFVLQELNEEYLPIVKKAFKCMNDTLQYLYNNIFCPVSYLYPSVSEVYSLYINWFVTLNLAGCCLVLTTVILPCSGR